jgi:threonine synthase
MTSDMASSPPSSTPLHFAADERYRAERSIVLRYAPAVLSGIVRSEHLLACSRGEGARVLDLGLWHGVHLKLLDESSAMASGTAKSLDGCVATALCRHHGIRQAVFSSGANAGSAITLYGAATGLETFFFCPAGNLDKVDGALFARPTARLVAVEGSDRRVKQAVLRFSELSGAALIPPLPWRMLASACRGLFLAERLLRHGERYDWLAQSVCAGYGPLGIYETLARLVAAGELAEPAVPRPLVVQQAGLCPIVRAWERGEETLPALAPTPEAAEPTPLLEPVLYNTHPDQTYPSLFRALRTWNGCATAVSQVDFERFAPQFLSLIENAGLRLTRSVAAGGERVLERSGLLAGAAVLGMVARGRIAQGQTVLCALTGGAGPAPAEAAMPIARVAAGDDAEAAVVRLAAQFAKGS